MNVLVSERTKLDELWYELYRRNGGMWLTVLSGSMAPLMEIGDGILTRRIEPHRVRFGDIIVFEEANRLVAHRVIGKRGTDHHILFLQKGDANTHTTSISATRVIGKVVCIRKDDGYIRLDGFLRRCIHLLLGVNSYIVHLLHKRSLPAKWSQPFRHVHPLFCHHLLRAMPDHQRGRAKGKLVVTQ